jgi:hypothetical protein
MSVVRRSARGGSLEEPSGRNSVLALPSKTTALTSSTHHAAATSRSPAARASDVIQAAVDRVDEASIGMQCMSARIMAGLETGLSGKRRIRGQRNYAHSRRRRQRTIPVVAGQTENHPRVERGTAGHNVLREEDGVPELRRHPRDADVPRMPRRALKRQWKDALGVVHEIQADRKMRLLYNRSWRLWCGWNTPSAWRSTDELVTCLGCLVEPHRPVPTIRVFAKL